jgi:epoxyqueuosine reductase
VNNIIGKLHHEMEKSGYRFRTVSITHLADTQEAVNKLVRHRLLAKRLCENWHFYRQGYEVLPEAKSIVIVAIPQPIIRLVFHWQGTARSAEIAPSYTTEADKARVENIINKVLQTGGYKAVRARLALKTLAVRSGLAEYGRNNLVYVPGMGSLCILTAFYTDCPADEDNWQKYKVMDACADCSLCRKNCPTGSITGERFLIHAENCLGFLNERQPDFPYWARLQPDWQNALVGCMLCQSVCPVNEPYLGNIREGASFSEKETGLILDKTPFEELPPVTRQKLYLDAAPLYPLLASNLAELIDKQKSVR